MICVNHKMLSSRPFVDRPNYALAKIFFVPFVDKKRCSPRPSASSADKKGLRCSPCPFAAPLRKLSRTSGVTNVDPK